LQPADFEILARNVYSQAGEDGILEWLFSKIKPQYQICVEFGAWDGRHLSNTFNLVAHQGWKSVYIEGDSTKFQVLKKTAITYPQITPLLSFVAASGPRSLDNILQKKQLPENFDLLSIDVDGNDYDIWEGVTRFRPRVVIIEHNPSIPPGFEYIDRGGRAFMGSSATSLHQLALQKGYQLLGCTRFNSFFLQEELFAALEVRPQKVEEAFDCRELCQVFTNFAGELVFSNNVVKDKLRKVVYASWTKTLSRRLANMPTYYVLNEPHAKDTVILKLFRKLTANWRALAARSGVGEDV
jgi:Methyltransferase FkbM domain